MFERRVRGEKLGVKVCSGQQSIWAHAANPHAFIYYNIFRLIKKFFHTVKLIIVGSKIALEPFLSLLGVIVKKNQYGNVKVTAKSLDRFRFTTVEKSKVRIK